MKQILHPTRKNRIYIASATNDTVGYYIAVVSFFVGILLIGLIDYFVPSTEGDIVKLTVFLMRKEDEDTLEERSI